jgi:hypothetical protein
VNIFLLLFGIFIRPLPGVMVLARSWRGGGQARHRSDPLRDDKRSTTPVLWLITRRWVGCSSCLQLLRVPMSQLVRELVPFLWAHGAVLQFADLHAGAQHVAAASVGLQVAPGHHGVILMH